MVLRSTEEECAVLRARSAVQRFCIIGRHPRMEDFHRRSANLSRRLADSEAWSKKLCNKPGKTGQRAITGPDISYWDTVHQLELHRLDWDALSPRSRVSMTILISKTMQGSVEFALYRGLQ
jgi:alpha-1,3-glucan synthase